MKPLKQVEELCTKFLDDLKGVLSAVETELKAKDEEIAAKLKKSAELDLREQRIIENELDLKDSRALLEKEQEALEDKRTLYEAKERDVKAKADRVQKMIDSFNS